MTQMPQRARVEWVVEQYSDLLTFGPSRVAPRALHIRGRPLIFPPQKSRPNPPVGVAASARMNSGHTSSQRLALHHKGRRPQPGSGVKE